MPDLAPLHPQIVHFAIALLFVGVGLRFVSLTGWFPFSGPAATTLILLGTLASVAAVRSGVAAHAPVEQVPGTRAAVVEHEAWGERARNVFLGVSALELIALVLARVRSRRARLAAGVSALIGLAGLFVVYEAASHGGELVYAYAGGVGIKSGNPADVGRLLVAATYHQAGIDREAGRHDQAGELIELTARRLPDDLEVQLMAAESLLTDRKNPAAALAKLQGLPRSDQDRLRLSAGLLTARAHQTIGDPQSARVVLQALNAEFPANAAVQRQLEQLGAQ